MDDGRQKKIPSIEGLSIGEQRRFRHRGHPPVQGRATDVPDARHFLFEVRPVSRVHTFSTAHTAGKKDHSILKYGSELNPPYVVSGTQWGLEEHDRR